MTGRRQPRCRTRFCLTLSAVQSLRRLRYSPSTGTGWLQRAAVHGYPHSRIQASRHGGAGANVGPKLPRRTEDHPVTLHCTLARSPGAARSDAAVELTVRVRPGCPGAELGRAVARAFGTREPR